jgi:hypothetical protein
MLIQSIVVGKEPFTSNRVVMNVVDFLLEVTAGSRSKDLA